MSLRIHPHQRGAVAVSFILLVILLLGFVGLATDVSRLYVSKSELQNAADACALAAVAALTGANTGQLSVAEAYGITAGTRNKVGMQRLAVSIPADSAVLFSDNIDGNYQPRSLIAAGSVLNMRFARCRLTESSIPLVLLNVLRGMGQTVNAASVSASATATLSPSISNCALPLAICKKTSGAAPNFGFTVGEWFSGRLKPGSGVNGKYGWVEFQGYERTKDLADLLSKTGQCNLNDTPQLSPHSGVISSLVDVWNWRFGVKKNSGPPAGALPPDLTGYAYTATNWPTQSNAYADFISRRAANTPWNGQPALSGGWSASTAAVHAAGGDRRMVVMPIVDCASWNSGGSSSQAIMGWGCALMLNPVSNPNDSMGLEYRGSAAAISSGCVSSGAPGGPGAGGPKVPTLVM